MLLTTIIVILFYVGVYIFLNKVYPQPIKNKNAQREFKIILRQVYAAKTMEELKDYREWFLEFIFYYELTKEEKIWYNDTFFDVYAKKLTRVKEV